MIRLGAHEVLDLKAHVQTVPRLSGRDQRIDHIARGFQVLLGQHRRDEKAVAVVPETAFSLTVLGKCVRWPEVQAGQVPNRVVVLGAIQTGNRYRTWISKLAPIESVDGVVDPFNQLLALLDCGQRRQRRHFVLAQDAQCTQPHRACPNDRSVVRVVLKNDAGSLMLGAVALRAVGLEEGLNLASKRRVELLVRRRRVKRRPYQQPSTTQASGHGNILRHSLACRKVCRPRCNRHDQGKRPRVISRLRCDEPHIPGPGHRTHEADTITFAGVP